MTILFLVACQCSQAFQIGRERFSLLSSSSEHKGARPFLAPFTATTTKNLAATRLFSSSSETVQEVESMRAGEIKKELESYGISTRSFLEKKELVEALIKARADGLKPKS